ncbi:TOBE domain-containing protein [Methylomarinum sp. Ch1-1]|uniref:TOBE domain-containing protein n=1 Tax=Methylomarinum roseum TaxID=3067653 RepID=A0AAU7NT31_9GAMM|nr:TOBE domain-containing protein [Methylomarinum sp. Ch1-1]MDP4520233.1 TOBE domain-containing protein [Methylomarinum sp. Ch1-1]
MKQAATPNLLSSGRKHNHLELLERIDASGSIRAAANALGMSYKAAWDAVENINNLSAQPLVERRVGGRNGGGAVLTTHGRRLVAAYRRLDKERERVLAHLNRVMDDFDTYYEMIRRFDMKTSARNQFLGKIIKIKEGAVNAEVILNIGGGDELVAGITLDSLKHLELTEGMEAYALIKSQWVILSADNDLKTSARNRLCGSVARCQEGAVNSEIILELPGGKHLTAIVTNDSYHDLGLKPGMRACALIKSSHVILAVAS